MHKTMIAVAALSAILVGQASAADPLGTNTSYGPYGTTGMVPGSGFGGFYAGGNLGYGRGEYSDRDGDTDIGGFLGGLQAGYNADLGGLVIGVEGDYQLSDIKFEENRPVGDNYNAGLNHYGTVRGRAGIDIGGIMPYATGGVAFGDIGYQFENTAGQTVSESEYGWGLAAGLGIEAMAANNMSLKAEYLYVGFGEYDLDGDTVDANAHTTRVGLNFHF